MMAEEWKREVQTLRTSSLGFLWICLFAVLGLVPRPSHMLGEGSATELHPQPKTSNFK